MTVGMRHCILKAFTFSRFIKDNPGRIYRILTLILVAGICIWTSWNLFDTLESPSQNVKLRLPAGNALSTNRAQQLPAPPQELSAYSSIMKKNPFGFVASVGTKPTVESPPPPPPPPELLGTISFGNSRGFAILKETGQDKAKVFKIGDSVSGGRTLVQVTRNTAVFKKGAEMETLYARTRPLQSLALQKGGENSPEKLIARNELMKSLHEMIDQSMIRPHFTNGKMDGFTIGRISPDSPLKAKGFESGDILQGVNDQIIKEADDVFLLQSLNAEASSARTTFHIMRRGQPIVLNGTENEPPSSDPGEDAPQETNPPAPP